MYLPVKHTNGLDPVVACLLDIKAWISIHLFSLNESKTDIVVYTKIKYWYFSTLCSAICEKSVCFTGQRIKAG